MSDYKPTPQGLIKHLKEIILLFELSDANAFKTRAFERALGVLESLTEDDLIQKIVNQSLQDLEGVGKGISTEVYQFWKEGYTELQRELKAKVPGAVLEFVKISGVGKKKAFFLAQDMGLKNIDQLQKACLEGLVSKQKGFGVKTEIDILKGIRALGLSKGKLTLDRAFELSKKVEDQLGPYKNKIQWDYAGDWKLKREVVCGLELGILIDKDFDLETQIQHDFKNSLSQEMDSETLKVSFFKDPELFYQWQKKGSCSDVFWQKVKDFLPEEYEQKVAPLAPHLREEIRVLDLSPNFKMAQSVEGFFHFHTTQSDGTGTLSEMVQRALQKGYKYVGVSEHSQSAFYAGGLKIEDLKKQKNHVKELQQKFPQIKIFWGIESDILQDGSLDYQDEILADFDFVIASIHTRFKMDKDQMTQRIIKAIQNPRTTMIGHLTGRFLLERDSFEVDIPAIIEQAAKHKVIIELNSHPVRLDVDWRWGELLTQKNCMVSINPDAHSVAGIDDIDYGILMSQKALLSTSQILNTRSVGEVQNWLKMRHF